MPYIPEVQPLTPNVIGVSGADFAGILAELPHGDLGDPRRVGGLGAEQPRLRIPGRPDLVLQWANMSEIGDDVANPPYRKCTPDIAPDYINDYEREAARMRSLGIDVPEHNIYLADGSRPAWARVYTLAHRPESIDAFSLSDITLPPDSPMLSAGLAVTRGMFNYFTRTSFCNWRIETAQEHTSFGQSRATGRPTLLNTDPSLMTPRFAAEGALNGLIRIIRRAYPTAEAEELLSDIRRYKQANDMPEAPELP